MENIRKNFLNYNLNNKNKNKNKNNINNNININNDIKLIKLSIPKLKLTNNKKSNERINKTSIKICQRIK